MNVSLPLKIRCNDILRNIELKGDLSVVYYTDSLFFLCLPKLSILDFLHNIIYTYWQIPVSTEMVFWRNFSNGHQILACNIDYMHSSFSYKLTFLGMMSHMCRCLAQWPGRCQDGMEEVYREHLAPSSCLSWILWKGLWQTPCILPWTGIRMSENITTMKILKKMICIASLWRMIIVFHHEQLLSLFTHDMTTL